MINTNKESTKLNNEKIWTKDFVLICLAQFSIFLGFQMTLPTLPLFIKELNGSDQLIGILVGVYTFSAMFFRPFAGKALESKGRKFVYLVGITIFIFSVGSFGLVKSIIFLMFLRVVQGVGWGLSSTATGTIATDIIPLKRRGEGLGYFSIAGNLAMAIGPGLGLLIVNKVSFNLFFLMCGALGLLALLFATKIHYKEIINPKQQTVTVKFDFFEKTAIGPSILIFFITVAFGGISSFLPLYALEKGIPGIELYFLIYALSLFFTRTFSGKIYDLKGHLFVFPPGAILIFIAMLLLAWLPNLLTMLIAAAFYGLGFGMVAPTLQAWSVEKAPANRKGMANATHFSFFDLGIGLGAITFGILAVKSGYTIIYLTSALSVFFSLCFYLFLFFKEKTQIS